MSWYKIFEKTDEKCVKLNFIYSNFISFDTDQNKTTSELILVTNNIILKHSVRFYLNLKFMTFTFSTLR